MITMEALAAAEAEALAWPGKVLGYVANAKPEVFRGLDAPAWVVTVALARKEQETPEQAADRLNQYVALYIERHGVSPSMLSLRGA